MVLLNNVLDSLAAVGDKVGFFTGIGHDLGKLKQVMAFAKTAKQPSMVNAVSPTKIGVIRTARAEEAEDDRWCQVEGGSPLRWRSCKSCLFLCAEHDSTCEVCGTLAPVPIDEANSSCENLHVMADRDCQDSGLEEYTGQVFLEEATDDLGNGLGYAMVKTSSPVHEQASESNVNQEIPKSPREEEEDAAGKNEEDSESESECEMISGTLDTAPPARTLVKVLFDDGIWYPGQVLTTKGTLARIRLGSGSEETFDVAEHAVRLADYVDSEEEDAEDEQGQQKNDEKKHEAEAEDSDEEDSQCEEEAIPGVLDDAPPVGTFVKVLFNDGLWHRAKILTSSGTKGTIVYDNGDQEELDFDEDAVRPGDYVDEDKDQEGSSEEPAAATCEAKPSLQAERVENKCEDNDSDSEVDNAQEDRTVPAMVIGRQTCVNDDIEG